MVFIRLFVLIIWVALAWQIGIIPANQVGPLGRFIALSFFVAAPLLYLLPTIEGYFRQQPNQTSIALVNIFLGWTLVGWVVAIAWACKKPQPTPQAFLEPFAAGAAIPIRSRAASPGVETKVLSVADELQKLADLKSQGVLTQDEFDTQKAKLLG